jgi:anti-sigma regulatory factor (Ser/Thr protein kinase)
VQSNGARRRPALPGQSPRLMGSDAVRQVERGAVATDASELYRRALAARANAAELLVRSVHEAPLGVRLSLPATEEAPAITRDAVTDLVTRAGADESAISDIRTVVTEAVSNAARHAYDGPPGPVSVDAIAIGRVLTVVVADEGRGPHVPSPDPGAGLGWKMIAALTERWTILERGAGGTTLYVRMSLADVGLRPAGV